MRSPRSDKGFAHLALIIILVVALIAGIGSLAYMRMQQAKSTTQANVTHRESVVTAAVTSTGVDVHGAAVMPTTEFKPTEPVIYVVATLKNVRAGTRIAYTRYLNNKFVDNGSLKVPKDGAQYVDFSFPAKQGKTHLSGKYRVKLYTNGAYERAVNYEVK